MPHQPVDENVLKATKRQIGNKNDFRCFRACWYKQHPWLNLCLTKNAAYCFSCRKAHERGLVTLSKKLEEAFTVNGFKSWQKATKRFREHEESDGHREAVSKLRNDQQSVSAMLSDKVVKDQSYHRQMLLKQLSCLRFLLRQGLSIRGHKDEESNLRQLLQMICNDSSDMQKWLQGNDYLSPVIINEQISLMGHTLLRKILSEIHVAKWFAILADEVRDVSNLEQLSISVRWVDENLEIHEDCLGLLQVPSTHANVLTQGIKDIMVRCSLPLVLCRGQAYDGASSMSGRLNGVAAQISRVEPLALRVHCLAHSLNLALQDMARKCTAIRDALDICKSISQLINWSPKRMQLFHQWQKEFGQSHAGNIRPLCPTRWTVRTGAINAILVNYDALLSTMDQVNREQNDEYGQRAGGVLAQLERFSSYFGLRLAYDVFSATEQVSITIQSIDTTVAEAVTAKELAKKHLERLRKEERFDTFYDDVVSKAADLTNEPSIPRYRHAPRRIDDGAQPHRFSSPREYHRQMYFEVLDLVAGEMDRRFAQETLKIPSAIESILLSSCTDEGGEIHCQVPEIIRENYDKDIDMRKLGHQLSLLPDLVKIAKSNPLFASLKEITNIRTLAQIIREVPVARQMVSEVEKLLRIYLTIPVTTATAERSFSALRRLKSYLRSTMSQQRLNNVMLLHIHKQITDSLCLKDIARDFASANDRRVTFFGKF
ncbi:zinc finger MYM-type protein 1-like [Ptychodera flava]|uniref:zinc finger MYM-type protein 1-like n=1 Tax=Ptychodera flava TaxID=63121 RepID=UPI00396A6591